MDTPISRAEHEEFRRRMEEEHKRQDKRIEELEEKTEEIPALAATVEKQDTRIENLEEKTEGIFALTTSVEKLAVNMENMLKEQEKQGERLQSLEERDGKKWRDAVKYVLTTIAGLLIGWAFSQFFN